MRVPHRLAVIVRVDIDEAWRHGQTVGIDLLTAVTRHFANRCDGAVLHRDVADKWRTAVAVHDRAAAYDDVEFAGHVSDPFHRLPSRTPPLLVGGDGGRGPRYWHCPLPPTPPAR